VAACLLYFTVSAVNGRVHRNSEKSAPKGRTAEEKLTPNKAKINPETLSPCSALRSYRLQSGNTGLNAENKAERHEIRPHLCGFFALWAKYQRYCNQYQSFRANQTRFEPLLSLLCG